jgi:hypothetical protein
MPKPRRSRAITFVPRTLLATLAAASSASVVPACSRDRARVPSRFEAIPLAVMAFDASAQQVIVLAAVAFDATAPQPATPADGGAPHASSVGPDGKAPREQLPRHPPNHPRVIHLAVHAFGSRNGL